MIFLTQCLYWTMCQNKLSLNTFSTKDNMKTKHEFQKGGRELIYCLMSKTVKNMNYAHWL